MKNRNWKTNTHTNKTHAHTHTYTHTHTHTTRAGNHPHSPLNANACILWVLFIICRLFLLPTFRFRHPYTLFVSKC